MTLTQSPRIPVPDDGWIRVADIARSELTATQAIGLAARALEELGMAQALVMIHGKERGIRRYWECGGNVRFDADREPIIHISAAEQAS